MRWGPKAETWRGLLTNASARTATAESKYLEEYFSMIKVVFILWRCSRISEFDIILCVAPASLCFEAKEPTAGRAALLSKILSVA
jgi:hypothetical protein